MSRRPTVALLRWLPAALVAVAIILAFASPLGVDLAWSLAAKRLPEDIKIASVEGRFIGPITVTGVDVSVDAADVTVDRVVFDWRPSRLLMARVHIAQLAVDGLDVTLKPGGTPPPEPAPTDGPPSLDLRAPITLVAEDVRLTDARFAPAPDAPVERLDRLALRGAWDRSALELAKLEIDAPRTGPVQAHAFALLESNAVTLQTLEVTLDRHDGSLSADGLIRQAPAGYRLALDSQWRNLRWPLDGDPMVRSPQGTVAVSGRLPNLQGSADIQLVARDATARIQATGRQADDAIDATVQWTDLAWPLETTAGPVAVRAPSGEVRIQGPLQAMDLRADARVEPAAAKPLDIALTGKASPERLQLAPLTVRTAGSTTRLSGRIRWAPALAGQLQLASENLDPSRLSPALADWPGQLTANADVDLRSPDDGLVIDLTRLRVDGQLRDQPLAVDARATVTPSAADVPTLTLQALGGRMTGSADVGFGDALSGNANLQFSDIDPGVLAPDWPGALAGQLQVQLRGTPADPEVRVPGLTVDGRLRDRPVALEAVLAYIDGAAQIDQLTLRSGQSRLSAGGEASAQRLDLRVDVDSPALVDFYPGLRGTLTVSGQVRGPAARPHITAQANGEGIGYQGVTLGQLDLQADTNLTTGAPFDVTLRVTDGDLAGTGIRAVSVDMTGPVSNHTLTVDVDTTQGQLQLAATGDLDLDGPGWDGAINTLVADPVDFDAWRLDEPVTVSAAPGDWQVDTACLSSGRGGGLCARAQGAGPRVSVSVDIDKLDLAYITPLLPPATRLAGELRGSLAYSRDAAGAGRESLTSDLTTSRIELSGQRRPKETLELVFAPGELTAREADGATDLRLRLPLAGDAGRGLDLTARLTGSGPIVQRGLDGQLTVGIQDLEFLELLADQLTDITGRLTADAALAGTVSAPRVDGRLALEDAAASVDAAGIDLREVSVQVSGNDRTSVRVTASARSGEGTVRAEATARLGKALGLDATVTGERFTAFNTEDARIVITPDLQFAMADNAAELKGKLRIPTARITPQKRDSASVVQVSDDEVIVGPRAEAADAEALKLRATVNVELGDDVRFEGFGLTTRIAGEITARDRPGTQTTATGELRLEDGAYKAYGQNLDIRRGRLIFAGGAVTQPGLDIKASRYPTEDVEVGVRVRGPISQPEFALYSEPDMTQQEQLSYLVLGRSMERGSGSGASGAEQAALANAALALGLRGGGFLADTLQDKVGLDEISIGAQAGEGNDQASLVLGKYLSPKLYVSYGVALFRPGQSFRLRYQLSSKWTLKTETGTQTGGDLIYTIERD